MITKEMWLEFIALYISVSPEGREQAKAVGDPELVDVMEGIDRCLQRIEQAEQK